MSPTWDEEHTMSEEQLQDAARIGRRMTEGATPPTPEGPCIFDGCVSRDRHWHFGFPGGYDDPADPTGPPIPFTREPEPGVRDYNGALLGESR